MVSSTDRHFILVRDVADLNKWLSRPDPAVLFLHDPGCPISRYAYSEAARVDTETALLDVRNAPKLAGEVERRTGVRHESPQVLVIHDGQAVWDADHFAISTEAIATALDDAGTLSAR